MIENEKQAAIAGVNELKERVTAFCRQAGYRLSPQADVIFADIAHMKEAAGDYYCTCQTRREDDTICVCQAVQNGLVDLMGACYCGLILAAGPPGE